VGDPGSAKLHPALEPLSWLLGSWEGTGEGLWAAGFSFTDVVSLVPDEYGRPLVAYHQRTYLPDGHPSHGEMGYLVVQGSGGVQMTVAEPSGITETLSGRSAGSSLDLASAEIGHAPESRNVTATARRMRLDGDRLVIEVDVAMNGEPLATHTRSVLARG
jgi:hypothetical protein